MVKIKGKRGINKIRISHNKSLLIVIIILIIILGFLIYFMLANKKTSTDITTECIEDKDCFAATCCHSSECVSIEKKPNCKGILCSMDCSGPLDCGAGYCGCVKNKCQAIKK